MTDRQRFAGLIWKHTGKAMTGSLLVALILAIGGTIWQGIAYLLLFLVVLLICILIAAYREWREEYHDARPYEEAAFESAKADFDKSSEETKAGLERIVIEDNVADTEFRPEPDVIRFLDRDFTYARYSLKPAFSKIIPRIVSEWRKSKSKDSPSVKEPAP